MKKLAMLVLVVAVVGFTSVSIAKPKDSGTPKAKPTQVGKVVVVKDADGVITAVHLENKRLGTCNIVLDAKGKELGDKMEGKMVGLKAVGSEKDGEKWLTVESYHKIQRAEGKDGNKDACGKDGNKGACDKGSKKDAREKGCDKGANEKGCKNKK